MSENTERGTTRRRFLGTAAVAAVGVALGWSGAPAVAAANAGTAPRSGFTPNPAPTYGVGNIVNVPVTMADRTQLVGSVYYPTDLETGVRAPGTFPVLVTMTPYGMWDGSSSGGADDQIPRYFASHGYLCVVVDTRGSGRSQGVYAFEDPQEMRDYLEVIDYAAHRLDGSNGVVGLSGMSYRGLNQLLVGGLLRPGTPVKAMAPASAGSIYRGIFFNGGIPSAFGAAYAGIETYSEVPPPDQLAAPGGLDPFHLARVVRDRVPTMLYHGEWWTSTLGGGHMAYQDDWWLDREPIYAAQAIVDAGVPVLLTSGHGDFFVSGALHMYAALQNAWHGRPVFAPMDPRLKPTERYQLVWSGSYVDGDYGYFLDYELQWFDRWLKGVDNGIGRGGDTLYIQEFGGEERWVSVPNSAYPMTSDYTAFYLNVEATLTPARPEADAADSLTWAPDSTLTYTTAPFGDGATLAGPVTAAIYASTSSSDIQLVATLQDVAPDGTARTVVPGLEVDGAQIGTQRRMERSRSWYDKAGRPIYPYHPFQQTSEEPVPTGQVVRLDIVMLPRMWSVQPGHRLRLVLASQDPLLIPTLPQASRLAGGTFLIQRGGEQASYLNLPVLPLDAFPSAADPTLAGLGGRPGLRKEAS